jgi:hypothetical protein
MAAKIQDGCQNPRWMPVTKIACTTDVVTSVLKSNNFDKIYYLFSSLNFKLEKASQIKRHKLFQKMQNFKFSQYF